MGKFYTWHIFLILTTFTLRCNASLMSVTIEEGQAFFDAISSGSIEEVRALYRKNNKLIHIKTRYTTPLHLAITHEQVEIVSFLLDEHIDPDLIDNLNRSPLLVAVEKNNIKIIKLLLLYKADINIENGSRTTPLHLATYHNKIEATEVLLTHGALYNIPNSFGHTALYYAQHVGGAMWNLYEKYISHPNPTCKTHNLFRTQSF